MRPTQVYVVDLRSMSRLLPIRDYGGEPCVGQRSPAITARSCEAEATGRNLEKFEAKLLEGRGGGDAADERRGQLAAR